MTLMQNIQYRKIWKQLSTKAHENVELLIFWIPIQNVYISSEYWNPHSHETKKVEAREFQEAIKLCRNLYGYIIKERECVFYSV